MLLMMKLKKKNSGNVFYYSPRKLVSVFVNSETYKNGMHRAEILSASVLM